MNWTIQQLSIVGLTVAVSYRVPRVRRQFAKHEYVRHHDGTPFAHSFALPFRRHMCVCWLSLLRRMSSDFIFWFSYNNIWKHAMAMGDGDGVAPTSAHWNIIWLRANLTYIVRMDTGRKCNRRNEILFYYRPRWRWRRLLLQRYYLVSFHCFVKWLNCTKCTRSSPRTHTLTSTE